MWWNIVLIGMMGVGKIVIGVEFVCCLGWLFWDIDFEIEWVVVMIILEIFVCDGEDFFCVCELEVLLWVLVLGFSIVLIGGGLWICEQNC